MHTQRRYSKRELLGQLRVEYLFSIHELAGITPSSSRWEVLGAFLKAGEARAERLIETDGGFLFLQSIPGRRSTGAIYAYNEAAQVFLWMRFDRDDDLNGIDFDHAVRAYRLLQWTTLERMPGNNSPQKEEVGTVCSNRLTSFATPSFTETKGTQ